MTNTDHLPQIKIAGLPVKLTINMKKKKINIS